MKSSHFRLRAFAVQDDSAVLALRKVT